ncbi:MAG: hypothetical protein L6R38_002295 [Xanthoria sp. 2 TBL-2021]|nr:MAG: hypothetical protein L6R38_002295 [Xanthoria sp. 2 TBL-2021]
MGSTHLAAQEVFSPYEQVYLHMSRAFKHLDKEHWGVHCVCSIRHEVRPHGQSTEMALREAWKQLAIEYPGLTVRPVNFTKHFQALDETILETWASQTFFSAGREDADSIVAETGPRDLPSLYWLPQSSEIVFLSQHWRTDALGCCILLDRLFHHLAAGESILEALQKEPARLSPSMEVAAGATLEENEDVQAYARERIATFHQKAVRSGGLPFEGDAKRLPAPTKHRDLTFTVDQTKAIVQACKSLDISVSAAIHTALARTYFSFADDQDEKKKGYTTVMAVNMRPHLQNPYNTRAHACQTYVSSITPTVPYATDFVDAARDLTLQYKTWCTKQLMNSLCWMYKYNAEKLFGPKPASPTAQETSVPPKPPSGVTLSSLGIVERHLAGRYGDCVTVERFRFGVSMMTRQTLLYAWTFRGELTLSFDYNEAYYTDDTAKEILMRVKAFLDEGLKVQV